VSDEPNEARKFWQIVPATEAWSRAFRRAMTIPLGREVEAAHKAVEGGCDQVNHLAYTLEALDLAGNVTEEQRASFMALQAAIVQAMIASDAAREVFVMQLGA
jgi:hypothetical protein